MLDQEDLDAIKLAVGAHGTWILKLNAAARTGKTNLPVEELSDAEACAFGKWLKRAAPELGQDPDFETIGRLHAEFHRNAGRLAAMIRDGQADAALEEMSSGAFSRQSVQLADAMTNWRMSLRWRS